MEKKQIVDVIADNLRTLMNSENTSINELARRCQVSTGTISKILNGNMSITIPMAMKIAEGLDVDISVLLQGLIDQKPTTLTLRQDAEHHEQLNIGILSINNRRITCVQDSNGTIVGRSELEGGLDLVETSGSLMQRIQDAIFSALEKNNINKNRIRQANLNLVTQSYEFEDTKHRFINFAKKQYRNVRILSDWQITYLSTFKDNPGISLIVDKGVSLSYRHNNALKKLGGWKFPVYDLGGENWLGVETIRHTIEAKEGYVPMSKLAHSVLAKFGGKIETITETCFKTSSGADIFCLFTETLLRAYFTKDPIAEAIIKKGFALIQQSIHRADDIIGLETKIAINGSLTDIYKPMIKKSRLIESANDNEKTKLLASITDQLLEKNGIHLHSDN